MDPQYFTDVLCNYLWKTRRPLYTNAPIIYENVHTLLKQGASRSLTCYDMHIPPVLVAMMHLHEPKLVKLLMDDTFDRNMKVPYMDMIWDEFEICDIGICRYYSIENIILIHYYEAQFITGLLDDKLVELYHKVVPVTPRYKLYSETESESESDTTNDSSKYSHQTMDNINTNTSSLYDNTSDTEDTKDIIEDIDLDINYDIEHYYNSDDCTDSDSDTSDESDTKSELLYNFYYGKCTVPEKETRDISDCSSNETPNKKRLIQYYNTASKRAEYIPRLKDLHYSSYIMSRIEEYCLMFNVDFKSLKTREEDVPDDVSKDPFE